MAGVERVHRLLPNLTPQLGHRRHRPVRHKADPRTSDSTRARQPNGLHCGRFAASDLPRADSPGAGPADCSAAGPAARILGPPATPLAARVDTGPLNGRIGRAARSLRGPTAPAVEPVDTYPWRDHQPATPRGALAAVVQDLATTVLDLTSMPEQTLRALRRHGKAKGDTITGHYADARAILARARNP